MQFPESFVRSLDNLPGIEPLALIRELETPATISVRFNPFKVAEKPDGRQVPWSRYGFYMDERPDFTLDPLFHAGIYYVQEASSMFIEFIYREFFGQRAGLKILDLSAAPGGKTTLLSAVAGLENTIVANEVVRSRAFTLTENVVKWGLGNVVVTNNDPAAFAQLENYFDMILVDAPCSGEGMFRKNSNAVTEWSPSNVSMCSARQRRIVADIWPALKSGGLLVYSTCTFNRDENENNIDWIAENYRISDAGIRPDVEWGVVTSHTSTDGENGSPISCFRFYPGKTEGEGFFCSAMVKEGKPDRGDRVRGKGNIINSVGKSHAAELSRWLRQPGFMHFGSIGENYYAWYDPTFEVAESLAGRLNIIHSGVRMGQIFHKKGLRPEHSLAMFHDLQSTDLNLGNLNEEQALDYLRKKDLPPSLFEDGMNLVTFGEVPLGWLKRIGLRTNNLYPKEYRIMNL